MYDLIRNFQPVVNSTSFTRLHNGMFLVSKNGYCIYVYRGTAPSGALERRKDFHVFDRDSDERSADLALKCSTKRWRYYVSNFFF